MVRQLLARTLYSTCRRAADGLSEISGTILRVVVGSDLGVDCTRALDRCASHLGFDSPASGGYAGRRWAALVIPVTRLRDDVPTMWAWSRHVAKSQSTIKTWCAAATFDVTVNGSSGVATIHDQRIDLRKTNVVLVDDVDTGAGMRIAQALWIDPQMRAPDRVQAVIRRSPELRDCLRCDAHFDDPAKEQVARVLCAMTIGESR